MPIFEEISDVEALNLGDPVGISIFNETCASLAHLSFILVLMLGLLQLQVIVHTETKLSSPDELVY